MRQLPTGYPSSRWEEIGCNWVRLSTEPIERPRQDVFAQIRLPSTAFCTQPVMPIANRLSLFRVRGVRESPSHSVAEMRDSSDSCVAEVS